MRFMFFGIHPSKARLNITQTQQVIKQQNLHPKKLAINNFHDFANVKNLRKIMVIISYQIKLI